MYATGRSGTAVCGGWHGLACLLVALLPPMVRAAAPPACGSAPCEGLFALYQANRDQGVPNYITPDLLLAGYSSMRAEILVDEEHEHLIPELTTVVDGLRAPPAEAGTPAAAYAAMLDLLLHGKEAPEGNAPLAAELRLVRQAGGVEHSPLWGIELDYSQFRPNGRYLDSAEAGAYFRALRYAAGIPLLLVPSAATGVTPEQADRNAATIRTLSDRLHASAALHDALADLERRLEWDYGPREDLSALDLAAQPDGKPTGTERERLLDRARQLGRRPSIIDGVVDAHALEPGQKPADVWIAWRLVPGRYRADAALFQRLVYPGTGPQQQGGATPFGLSLVNGQRVKGYASAREWLAWLGNARAQTWVRDQGEDGFAGYATALRAPSRPDEGSAAAHDHLLRQLGKADLPLDSLLGFWLWQRWSDQLYLKESASGVAKDLPEPRHGAGIDPHWRAFAALDHLAGLQAMHVPDSRWAHFAALARRCAQISRKAGAGQALPAAADDFLEDIDQALLDLAGHADHPLIASLQVNPAESQLVEAALAYPEPVEVKGARGGRFTYREFKQPLDHRLDDPGWNEMLRSETRPATNHDPATAKLP